jgi:DNA-binding MarR family transcriptional regulator
MQTVEQFRAGLIFETFVVSQLVGALLGEAIAGNGLTTVEYGVQSAIGSVDGITPAELAAMTGMPPSSLSRHIRRLTELGQVQREPHPSDGRSYRLRLTEQGRDTYRKNGAELLRLLARIDEHLPVPRQDVIDSLMLVEKALRQIQAEDAQASS